MKRSWAKDHLKKILNPEGIETQVESLKAQKLKIVTLNGCFDLLHAGHLEMIYQASLAGDVLIVALNSDDSIKRLKGENKPVVPLEYRLRMIAALEFVDYVTWFSEDDPRHLLGLIKPHVHANGAEYGENCIEAETVRKNGGRIFLIDRFFGLSTTEIINRIRQCV